MLSSVLSANCTPLEAPKTNLWSGKCGMWVKDKMCLGYRDKTRQYLEFCLHDISFFFVFPRELFILVVVTHQNLRLRIQDDVLLGSQRQTTVQTRPNTS